MKTASAKTYEAIIEGRSCKVIGFDDQQNLILSDGNRYSFERPNFKSSESFCTLNGYNLPVEEPAWDIFGCLLLEVAKLRHENGEWFLNDEQKSLNKWVTQMGGFDLSSLFSSEEIIASKVAANPDGDKRLSVWMRLKSLRDSVKMFVQAVAWFKHDDGAGGWDTPILLKSFRPILRSVALGKKPFQKPVARFENDFSQAVIPQNKGNDLIVTVEPELRKLVKAIIDAGGRIPRTKLRSGKSDNWRPEKLLESTVAKTLIAAGLIGKIRTGRTTVFWAKQSTS